MPFSVKSIKTGKQYFLHGRKMKNGDSLMYFFAGEVKEGAVDALPAGKEVIENARTGLPMLRNKVA